MTSTVGAARRARGSWEWEKVNFDCQYWLNFLVCIPIPVYTCSDPDATFCITLDIHRYMHQCQLIQSRYTIIIRSQIMVFSNILNLWEEDNNSASWIYIASNDIVLFCQDRCAWAAFGCCSWPDYWSYMQAHRKVSVSVLVMCAHFHCNLPDTFRCTNINIPACLTASWYSRQIFHEMIYLWIVLIWH